MKIKLELKKKEVSKKTDRKISLQWLQDIRLLAAAESSSCAIER
jgi:hypothetical protein